MLNVAVQHSSQPVIELLQRLQSRLADLQPVMESIGTELESRVSARFETQTDPDGQRWEPWAASTEVGYPKDGHGRILDRYGDMLRSLGHQAGPDSVVVGFGAVASKAGDVYAVYHEWGTKHMPRRGLLLADPDAGTLGAEDEASVLQLLEDWLSEV